MIDCDASLMRPDWMRPPCWRWNITMGYLAEPMKSMASVRRDASLYESVKYYRAKKIHQARPKFFITRHPEMFEAHDLFYNSHYGGWRWYIEALILAGLTDPEIKDALKVDISTDTINLYRRIFFDVTPYLHSEVAVNANILSTSRLEIKGKRDCDYTWKLFAYSWGAEAFLEQFAFKRKSISAAHTKWFKDLAKEGLTINAFQLASDLKKKYNMEALEILRIAKDYWTITDTDYQRGQNLADKDFITSLSSHIDMCLMNATKKSESVEERPNFQYAFLEESKG